jgi:hypothetical protein
MKQGLFLKKSASLGLLLTLILLLQASPTFGFTDEATRVSTGLKTSGKDLDVTASDGTVMATIFNAKRCPAYVFYGVRGSGEGFERQKNRRTNGAQPKYWYNYEDDPSSASVKSSDSVGIGSTLGRVFRALKIDDKFIGKISAAAPALYQPPRVEEIFSGEKASWSYFTKMAALGTNEVLAGLTVMAKSCPQTKIILAGYSQGAFIVSAVIQSLRTKGSWAQTRYPDVLNNIVGAVILADPLTPKTGIFSFLKTLRGTSAKKDMNKLANFIEKIFKNSSLSGSLRSFLDIADTFSAKIGSGITTFVNLESVTPKPSAKLPILSLYKTKDLVADGMSELKILDFTNCSKSILYICNMPYSPFLSAMAQHSSYSGDRWASDRIVPWLVKSVK